MSLPEPFYILVADDDQTARLGMVKILEDAGYKVIQAIDGGSARKVVHEHPVVAAIIDHYMEPHGGLEFAEKIHYDRYDIPMFLVTHEETTDLLIEATRAHFIGYMKKPVDGPRLVHAVERMIKLYTATHMKEEVNL